MAVRQFAYIVMKREVEGIVADYANACYKAINSSTAVVRGCEDDVHIDSIAAIIQDNRVVELSCDEDAFSVTKESSTLYSWFVDIPEFTCCQNVYEVEGLLILYYAI
jgi:hypothetical protein